jgi:hypothetical protein
MRQIRVPSCGCIATLVVMLLCLCVPQAPAAAPVSDSPADLQALFNQEQYAQLLSKLNAALSAKTVDADKDTRYQLLMLKGEALLRTKVPDAAGDAFKAAALVGRDDQSIAVARGNAALIEHSSAEKYQPKTKATTGSAAGTLPAPIDIVEPLSRKFAFVALFTDLVTVAKPQVERAEKMTTLPPIMEVATQLADIRPVEIAGTGADTRSKQLLKQVGEHASTLMTTALKSVDSQVATMSKQAAARKGKERASGQNLSEVLLPEDVSTLDNIAAQAEQISSSADTMQTTFGDAQTFKSVQTSAKKTVDDVNKLLKQYKHSAAS